MQALQTRLSELGSEQTTIIAQLLEDYNKLLKKNEELIDEVDLLKVGEIAQARKISEQTAQITQLESKLNRRENNDGITVCLLDGDGCVFAKEYLIGGDTGGKQAAALLRQEVAKVEDGPTGSLLTYIYVYQAGLRETLRSHRVCPAKNFNEFVTGFNRSSELFDIIDVGKGKEAADAKIREHLKIFANMPQVKRIIFGGSHDSGYATTLNSLRTDGLAGKIILLDCGQIAREIGNLNIPQISMPDLFMNTPFDLGMPASPFRDSQTLSPSQSSATSQVSTPPMSPETRWRRLGDVAEASPKFTIHARRLTQTSDLPRLETVQHIDPSKPLLRQTPSICYPHSLGTCNRRDCPHSHDYDLSDEDRSNLRAELKEILCTGGDKCRGDACWYRH